MATNKLRFIVYFPSDKQILEVSGCSISLGDFQEFDIEDWNKLGEQDKYFSEPMLVQAEYEGDWFEAVIVQVVLDENTNTGPTIAFIRDLIRVKRKSIDGILRSIIRINHGKQRNRFLAMSSVRTSEEESEADSSLRRTVAAKVAAKVAATSDSLRQVTATSDSSPKSSLLPPFNPALLLATAITPTLRPLTVTQAAPTPRLSTASTVPKSPMSSTQWTPAPSGSRTQAATAEDDEAELSVRVPEMLELDPEDVGLERLHPATAHQIRQSLGSVGIDADSLSGVAHLAMICARQTCNVAKRLRQIENVLETLVASQQSVLRMLRRQATGDGAAAAERQDAEFQVIDSWEAYVQFISSAEQQSSLKKQLWGCKDKDLPETIRRMMRKCLSPAMMCLVNWGGRDMRQRVPPHLNCTLTNNEMAFKNAFKVFDDVIQEIFPKDERGRRLHPERSVELAIIDVLRHATEREASRRKRAQQAQQAELEPVQAAPATPQNQVRRQSRNSLVATPASSAAKRRICCFESSDDEARSDD